MTTRFGPLKYWLTVNDSGVWGEEPSGDGDVEVLRSTDIRLDGSWSLSDPAVRSIGAEQARAKRLRAGDLVVVTSSGSEAHLGKTAITTDEVAAREPVFANFVQRLRPTANADGRFIRYFLNSKLASDEMAVRGTTSTGLRNLNGTILGDLPFPVTSAAEQRAIADFLDTETARIDALITKKRRLIEVVHARLTALVDRLMSPAQSDPAPSLSAVIQIAEGQVDPTVSPYREMCLIAPNHVKSNTGRILNLESAEEQGAVSGKYLCEAGDVIYSKIRPNLAKACLAPSRCLTSADMYPMRPLAGLLPEYLLNFLLSPRFTGMAVLESERVAMPKINRDALGRIRIPLPPVERQRDVVGRLATKRRLGEETVLRLARQITLLQEKRQALITVAVTGELEIPGMAA